MEFSLDVVDVGLAGTAVASAIADKGVGVITGTVAWATTCMVGTSRVCSRSNWDISRAITTVSMTPTTSSKLAYQGSGTISEFIGLFGGPR
jgi:hypothetical protein